MSMLNPARDHGWRTTIAEVILCAAGTLSALPWTEVAPGGLSCTLRRDDGVNRSDPCPRIARRKPGRTYDVD